MIIGHFRFRREGYAGWKSDDQHPFPKSATASSALHGPHFLAGAGQLFSVNSIPAPIHFHIP